MKFCSECGEDLRGSTKFCPECGFNIGDILIQKNTDHATASTTAHPADHGNDILDEEPIAKKTTKELGTNLENMVAKILLDRGFSTKTRTKLRGKSGQLSEIDIIAKRNGVTTAIECKNYAESTKIGVKEIRDFSAKLVDLGIHRGLFVTSSSFSQGAVQWATNNPHNKQIDLWDGSKLSKHMRSVILGRTSGGFTKIHNCLNPRDTIENYSKILLKNKNNIVISQRDLVFYPYYIIQFTIREQFKTPDKQIHSQFNSGQYVTDGLTGDILFRSDDTGDKLFRKNAEQKQVIYDLRNIRPHKTIKIKKISNSNIFIRNISIDKKSTEFSIKKKIIEDNKQKIPYRVKKSRREYETKRYTHVPNLRSISLQSKVIHVPKLHIQFKSKKNFYTRKVLPASDVVITDEISICKHILRKKHTFAVCDVCGIAKCEDHIFVDESNRCYCEKHASDQLRESKKKGKSIRDRLGLSSPFRKR